MASKSNLSHLVGQLFIVGFDGYSVSTEFRKVISEYNLGGVIYFKRNCQTPAQLAELGNDIQFSCRKKDQPFLFTSIDHEGGKVNRLAKPFTLFAGNEHLGEINSPKMGFQFGVVTGTELKAVGINVNFAPVVDVATNPNNPVMNGRMFSKDPETCGRLGSSVVRGLQKAGILAVAKHFPGHGDTKVDSHYELPRIDKSYEQLEQLELIPFKRVCKSRVEGVMTAHILNPSLDPELPATLSERTITEILRNKIRYTKLIFSDDMEMQAITDHFGQDRAAVLAINAGCDQLIYRGEKGFPISAYEAVIKAVESKEIPLAKIEASLQRIVAAKKVYANLTGQIDVTQILKSVGLPEHTKLAELIAKKERLSDEEEDEGAV